MNSMTLLTDLSLSPRGLDHLVSNRDGVDLVADHADLSLSSGQALLTQSVLNRLLTRVGELATLGHPDYGSRLYLLVGEPNNQRTQALANLYIRESLADEELIEELLSIRFSPASRQAHRREKLDIQMSIQGIAETRPITISMTMDLDN